MGNILVMVKMARVPILTERPGKYLYLSYVLLLKHFTFTDLIVLYSLEEVIQQEKPTEEDQNLKLKPIHQAQLNRFHLPAPNANR